jgi:hypothetical protein
VDEEEASEGGRIFFETVAARRGERKNKPSSDTMLGIINDCIEAH